MSREEEIRAAALLAAARGAVNPGVVIVNAKRFAHYIINGTDFNEVPVVVPAKDGEFRRIKHDDGCAFLDSRGFCTCGADPALVIDNAYGCLDCAHTFSSHKSKGVCLTVSGSGFVCRCSGFNKGRRLTDV